MNLGVIGLGVMYMFRLEERLEVGEVGCSCSKGSMELLRGVDQQTLPWCERRSEDSGKC